MTDRRHCTRVKIHREMHLKTETSSFHFTSEAIIDEEWSIAYVLGPVSFTVNDMMAQMGTIEEIQARVTGPRVIYLTCM